MGAKSGRCNKVGGGHIDFQFELRYLKEVYRDKYTNEILPPHLIQAAIIEELEYVNSQVWEMSDVKAMKAFPDSKLVKCRWVLCNKGDAQNLDVWARLVACKVNYGSKADSFYAATPTLEAKKILFAKYAHTHQSKRVCSRGTALLT